MRRAFTIAILIILSYLIQTVLFSFQDLSGQAPNLLLILTMSFGIMRGRREGMLTGFFSGFMYDLYFSDTIIGPFMLLFMLIGYANGFFHKKFMMQDIMLPVIIIFIDELVFNLIIYIGLFLMRNRTDIGYYFKYIFMPQAIYTVLVTAIIYRLYVVINKRIKKQTEKKVI